MKYFIIALLAVLIFPTCKPDREKEKLFSEITYLEEEIGTELRPSVEKLDSLMTRMENYAAAFPNDSVSAGFLYRAAEISRANGNFDHALVLYEKILSNHATSPLAAKALFMKAFTLDNDLKRLEDSRTVYEEFLKKYPDDDFADDASFLLKNLGKSEEEIMRQFEKSQESNSIE